LVYASLIPLTTVTAGVTLLLVAGQAFLVVCPAMAFVTAGRVDLSFDPVSGEEISTVDQLPVGTVAMQGGRFYLDTVGVAVVAEGCGVTYGTDPLVAARGKAMILDEQGAVIERRIRLEGPIQQLVLVAFTAVGSPCWKGFRMAGRNA